MSMHESTNYSISILRVISTVMIVLCHIVHYYPLPGCSFLGQILCEGVQVFLLISGFLYGGKTISSFKAWFIARIKRVSLPVMILSIAVIITKGLLHEQVLPITAGAFVLNLQGLVFLNGGVFSKWINEIDVLGPLWFCTIIMLCYLLVPLLQRTRPLFVKSSQTKLVIVLLTLLFLALLILTGTNLIYFLIFVFGYYLGSSKENIERELKLLNVIKWVIIGVSANVLRLVFRGALDGTKFYSAYTQGSSFAFAISVFIVILWFGSQFPLLYEKIGKTRSFRMVDYISFYIYLSHGIFCMGTVTNVFLIVENKVIATAVFSLFTIVTAVVLQFCTEKLLMIVTVTAREK